MNNSFVILFSTLALTACQQPSQGPLVSTPQPLPPVAAAPTPVAQPAPVSAPNAVAKTAPVAATVAGSQQVANPYTIEQVRQTMTVGTTFAFSFYVEGDDGYESETTVIKVSDAGLTLRFSAGGEAENRTQTWQEFVTVFAAGDKVKQLPNEKIGAYDCLVYMVEEVDEEEESGFSPYVTKRAFAIGLAGPPIYIETTYDGVVTDEMTLSSYKKGK